jgi:hypothetical protein
MKHSACIRDDVILGRCETGSRTASLQGWIYGVPKIISSSGTQSYAGHAERSCLIGGHF